MMCIHRCLHFCRYIVRSPQKKINCKKNMFWVKLSQTYFIYFRKQKRRYSFLGGPTRNCQFNSFIFGLITISIALYFRLSVLFCRRVRCSYFVLRIIILAMSPTRSQCEIYFICVSDVSPVIWLLWRRWDCCGH